MKILVTGGAGYIGSITSELLLKERYEVVVVDNLQEGHRGALLPAVTFYEGDYGDSNILGRIFSEHRIDAVFHFAGETTIEFSMTDPAKYFDNNLVKGITLLDTMRKFGCLRFIFSSTAATFGEPEYVPIDEAHPRIPINSYGESKLMFEKVLDWYHKAYGLKFMAFRYFNAAGTSKLLGEDHRHESHLIPLVLQVVLEKRENVSIFGTDYPTKDGTCIRDYIHVIDLAQAHILGLGHLDDVGCRLYNLGNGEGYSVKEVIEAARKITGHSIPALSAPRRSGDPARLVASSERIRAELGWTPQYADLDTIIESAWQWHKSHPAGYDD
ncbi:MAG: UDP-glucose 4-epimerase GalE [Bacteroidales bacterium]|nr:UDP-glucose 4-epimerase GalE [Bacteroidales bacterium]